jgi:putative DNA primase/helicase
MKINNNQSLTVEELAKLPQLEYERIRKGVAKELGVRAPILDKEVSNIKKKGQSDEKDGTMFPSVDVWPEPVDAEELLDELVKTIKRFIICDDETAIASALWCTFTWFIDCMQVAPIAVITAPEMRCGKSQLLGIMGRLSYRPLIASNISPAAMFRVIEAHQPTLLIDEADTFLKNSEELRGVINSGHTRQSAYVIRTVGDNHEPKQFSTWGAKVICGIGSVANTIQDRSILLEMRRKLPDEQVERIRDAEPDLFKDYVSKLARFSEDAHDAIQNIKPSLPEGLNDRALDNWEPLFAIADYCGGKWPDLSRKTALSISGQKEVISSSAELLEDIKEIFDTKNIDRISSADLIKYLQEDDEKPWLTYNRGDPMTSRQLSKRLKEYNIRSKDIRFGYTVKKGYEKSEFNDAFGRYLTNATTLHNLPDAEPVKDCSVAEGGRCSATYNANATLEMAVSKGCSVVADKLPECGNGIVEVEI